MLAERRHLLDDGVRVGREQVDEFLDEVVGPLLAGAAVGEPLLEEMRV